MSSITQPLALPRGTAAALAKDYAELIKARVTTLIVMTAWCGFYFGAAQSGVSSLSWTLLHALLGIGLVSGGTAAMNEVIERDMDALMRRTAIRPLVKQSISVEHATVVSLAMIFGGLLYLAIATNLLTAGLTLLTSFVYLVAYTPLKKVTPLCTFVGAFPGAMPPALGWTAIRGRLEWEAFVLFAIVFFWQFPHFHSIALLYRDDYERAGIRMLPVVERSGVSTAQAIVVYGLALIPGDGCAVSDGHLRTRLFYRRGCARYCAVLLLPAHLEGETCALGAARQGDGAPTVAGNGALLAAAVCADDDQQYQLLE